MRLNALANAASDWYPTCSVTAAIVVRSARSADSARFIQVARQLIDHDTSPSIEAWAHGGVGTTRDRLPLKWRAIFAAVLRPQIADTELQERIVRDSGLTWVIVQPVALTDSRDDAPAWVARDGVVPSMSVSRSQVGAFLAVALETSAYDGQVVALSRRMT